MILCMDCGHFEEWHHAPRVGRAYCIGAPYAGTGCHCREFRAQ